MIRCPYCGMSYDGDRHDNCPHCYAPRGEKLVDDAKKPMPTAKAEIRTTFYLDDATYAYIPVGPCHRLDEELDMVVGEHDCAPWHRKCHFVEWAAAALAVLILAGLVAFGMGLRADDSFTGFLVASGLVLILLLMSAIAVVGTDVADY